MVLVNDCPVAVDFAQAHGEADAFCTRIPLTSDEEDCVREGHVSSGNDAELVEVEPAPPAEIPKERRPRLLVASNAMHLDGRRHVEVHHVLRVVRDDAVEVVAANCVHPSFEATTNR